MDLEFKKKMAKRHFRGPKKHTQHQRSRKVCVTGPLMVRMMRFFFTPLLTFSNLKKCDTKEEKKRKKERD
jgi:hypothetical protein